jgi:hypothetical protein
VLQLEEKRIPYTIEKINMRCYGDKPASFLSKVKGTTAPQWQLTLRPTHLNASAVPQRHKKLYAAADDNATWLSLSGICVW